MVMISACSVAKNLGATSAARAREEARPVRRVGGDGGGADQGNGLLHLLLRGAAAELEEAGGLMGRIGLGEQVAGIVVAKDLDGLGNGGHLTGAGILAHRVVGLLGSAGLLGLIDEALVGPDVI